MTRLTTCLDILSGVNASIILLGDFNLQSINWFHPMISSSVSNPGEIFIECVERNAMQQLVTDITRSNPNIPNNGSCLDLIITNDTFAKSDLAITSNFSTSDHHSVSFKITTHIPSYSIPSSRYDLPDVDWFAFNNHIFNIDWYLLFLTVRMLQPSLTCGMKS